MRCLGARITVQNTLLNALIYLTSAYLMIELEKLPIDIIISILEFLDNQSLCSFGKSNTTFKGYAIQMLNCEQF